MRHEVTKCLPGTITSCSNWFAVQDNLPARKAVQPAADPLDVPRTAMQEALHAGSLQRPQDQQQDSQVSRGQQAASLDEAWAKTSRLSLNCNQSPFSSGQSPRYKVVRNADCISNTQERAALVYLASLYWGWQHNRCSGID